LCGGTTVSREEAAFAYRALLQHGQYWRFLGRA
jgi:hypothetical protein